MEQHIWPVLTLLFQGGVGALIVLAVTKKIEARRERAKVKQYVMLLLSEVCLHEQILEAVRSIPIVPSGMDKRRCRALISFIIC